MSGLPPIAMGTLAPPTVFSPYLLRRSIKMVIEFVAQLETATVFFLLLEHDFIKLRYIDFYMMINVIYPTVSYSLLLTSPDDS